MKRVRFIALCCVGIAVSLSSGCMPRSGESKGIAYEYGKAEDLAEDVNKRHGVMGLIDIADRYRDKTRQVYEAGDAQAAVEFYARASKNWYREVLEREPSNAYANLCIGYVDLLLARATRNQQAQENHFSTAASRFEDALANRPGYADAYRYLAQVHALREEYAAAEKDLRLVLNSGIQDSDLHAWMAYVKHRQGDVAEADRHVKRAIELDDPSASARWSRQHQSRVGL